VSKKREKRTTPKEYLTNEVIADGMEKDQSKWGGWVKEGGHQAGTWGGLECLFNQRGETASGKTSSLEKNERT